MTNNTEIIFSTSFSAKGYFRILKFRIDWCHTYVHILMKVLVSPSGLKFIHRWLFFELQCFHSQISSIPFWRCKVQWFVNPFFLTVHPCDSASGGGCEHDCVKGEGREFNCTCREDYKLNADTKTCTLSK